jgi:hypothetical protein
MNEVNSKLVMSRWCQDRVGGMRGSASATVASMAGCAPSVPRDEQAGRPPLRASPIIFVCMYRILRTSALLSHILDNPGLATRVRAHGQPGCEGKFSLD